VIYDSSSHEVPLRSEIELINNYVGLQRYRVHPSTHIDFKTEVENENLPVMAMVFLPLLENGFKHGVQSETENGFIIMALRSTEDEINFSISNSKSAGKAKDAREGIGLKNIETRLNLEYPDRHTFTVTETQTEFAVRLKLLINQ
jgi:LytS/YehU family sensor histidine kinase